MALGRPPKKTPELVNKLLAAFNNGFNDTQACTYADISREAFYNWLEVDQNLVDRIAKAKEHPNMKAKENVITAINRGDQQASHWWLERRDPDFKNKLQVEDPDAKRVEDRIKEFMNARGRDDLQNDGSTPETGSDSGIPSSV